MTVDSGEHSGERAEERTCPPIAQQTGKLTESDATRHAPFSIIRSLGTGNVSQ